MTTWPHAICSTSAGVGYGTLVDVANLGEGDMAAGDDSLEAMLFRVFVRSEIGAAAAESMLQAAADAIARGLRGVTVVDELDRGTCAVNDALFSFRLRGWPTFGVTISQARAIITQELEST